MAGYKFWQRRESRNMKVVAKNQMVEAIAQLSGRDTAEGPKQMKIVVKKEDLKQLLEAIRDGRIRGGPPSTAAATTSLEQILNLLRRRQILRAKARSRSGSWRPLLQSIPEVN